MAHHQLAQWHERKAQGSFRCCPGAGRRRTTTADQGQRPATSTRGRGLAYRRTQDLGREEILSRQPAGEDRPAHLGSHHQGALDLRAGSPADDRRTRSGPLRGTVLARPSPSCAHDDDRLRLPPASPAGNSKAGKKESTGRRLSQLCPPYATPSSNSSLDYRRSDARIVENGFATSGGVSKSAKVVLDPHRLRWLAHPRPRAKPVEIAPGQSCELCIQVQICNERSTERCANIASKSCNGFVHLRFKQGSGAGSRSVERSGAFTFGLALFIIRTKEELRVNGDPMGRGEGELT